MSDYIGDKKIKEHSLDSGRVKVVFEDGSETTFSQKMFDASVSQEPLDATGLQERRILAVQAEFMTLLLSWDMKLVDIHRMLTWTSNFLNDKHELADEKLWGNSITNRTIGNLERVLTAGRGGGSSSAS